MTIAPAAVSNPARTVATNIRVAAWEKRMTQEQLGAALGVTGATISRKMRGDIPITVEELLKMAEALGIEDPGQLLPRLDSNQQPSGYTSALVGRLVLVRGWDGLEDYPAQITAVDEYPHRDLVVAVRAQVDGTLAWLRLDPDLLEPLEAVDELAA